MYPQMYPAHVSRYMDILGTVVLYFEGEGICSFESCTERLRLAT
jgi:hypothetical protein